MERVAAVITNGAVSNIVVVNPVDSATIGALGAVLLPAGSPVGLGWTYDGANFTVPPRYATLTDARNGKNAEIEAARDAACTANVSALGHAWQADARSQQLLGAAITLAQSGLPLPSVWRDAANADMPVTALSDLLAIAGAIATQTQTAYQHSWALKAQVAAAPTIAQVTAIVW